MLFHLLFVLVMRPAGHGRGLHGRTGGEQLTAVTWECELSFGMTSALVMKKKGIL